MKIARTLGPAEKMVTAIPGLTLHQRTGPTVPCAVAYVPGLIVMAQGRKRVELGPNKFIYDESRYLLTSLDLLDVFGFAERQPGRRGE
jgi:hypothetical protein